jgi:hypothetical protein
MTDDTPAATRARIGAIVAEIEANPFARIATEEADQEAYEIVRRIERTLARRRATPDKPAP